MPTSERIDRVMPPTIAIENLSLTLNGQRLLDRIDFQTHTPGTTMLMGPNGAGKSLLLRCIHGLLTPEQGTVRFFDQDAKTNRTAQAMVFQKAVLLRRTVRANLVFAAKAHGLSAPDIDDMLMRVHLCDKADQPARLLSGGEQQRLALARALLTRPKILLLDEPTASLDPASILIIEELIRQSTDAGVKTLFVSHDVGQAKRLASDVLFLHRGRLIEHSDAHTFFTEPKSKEAQAYLNGELLLSP